MNFTQTANPVSWEVTIEMETSHWMMRFRLFSELTPKTVENFTKLAESGKYDNCPFHRVIADFMVQWGDYTRWDGTGWESIWGEEFEDEFHDDLTHIRWALCMANAWPSTNGSQFFIVHAEETSWLNNSHTVFGQLIDGDDVLDDIAALDVDSNDRPLEPVTIEAITVTRE